MKANNRTSIDFILLGSVICLLAVGLVALLGASQPISEEKFLDKFFLFRKQSIFVLIGCVCLYISAKFDYRQYRVFGILLFFISVILLFTVFFAPPIRGSHRWLRIGSVGFLPSDLAQLAMVLYLSGYLSFKSNSPNKPKSLYIVYVILVVPSTLIFKQPNLPEAIIYALTGTCVAFLAGVRLKSISFFYLILALPLIVLFLAFSYHAQRIQDYINALTTTSLGTYSYQIRQSWVSLGSGGLTGVGLGEGIHKHFYVPDIIGTFIMCHIGEELGFLGTLFVVILFLILFVRGFLVALRTQDTFGKYLSSGITIWITIKALVNIGAVTGLLPIAGVPLPFISYGSSTIIIQLLSMGVLLNISRQTGEYPNYWFAVKELAKNSFVRNLQRIGLFSEKLGRHPLYKLLTYLALILTIIVCIIQLIYWFWLKR